MDLLQKGEKSCDTHPLSHEKGGVLDYNNMDLWITHHFLVGKGSWWGGELFSVPGCDWLLCVTTGYHCSHIATLQEISLCQSVIKVFWSALGSLQRRVSVVCSGTSAEAHPPIVPSVPPVHLLPVSVHRSLI